jgi:hypothetical protein
VVSSSNALAQSNKKPAAYEPQARDRAYFHHSPLTYSPLTHSPTPKKMPVCAILAQPASSRSWSVLQADRPSRGQIVPGTGLGFPGVHREQTPVPRTPLRKHLGIWLPDPRRSLAFAWVSILDPGRALLGSWSLAHAAARSTATRVKNRAWLLFSVWRNEPKATIRRRKLIQCQ